LDIDRTTIRLTFAAEANACVPQLLELRLSRREQPLSNMLRQRISKVDLKPVDPDRGTEIAVHHGYVSFRLITIVEFR
jgi:hypothetical protein